MSPGVEPLFDRPSLGGDNAGDTIVRYLNIRNAGVVVGIANFVTFLENPGDWRRELRAAGYGSLEEDREFLESMSPLNNVDRIAASLFVAHGVNDPRLPVDEARRIAEEARDRGVPVETLSFDDEGHGFTKLEN